MLLSVSRIQYLRALDLPDYRFRGIDEVYAAAVLAGLDELARMLVGYNVYVGSLVPDIIVYAVD